jgi:ABC-type polysaccharide/polyol phosphate transport system ATPase subunit
MARIRLDDVSVEYPIYNAGSMSLRNQLVAISTGGRMANRAGSIVTVMALDGVSLDLEDGDRLGLLGDDAAHDGRHFQANEGAYDRRRPGFIDIRAGSGN